MIALVNPITILLATLCMQWVEVATLGTFSMKLPYLTLALVIVYALTGPRKFTYSLVTVRRYAYWMVPLGLYIVLMGLIQSGTPASNSAPRQGLYLIGTIALVGSLAATPKLARLFRFGAAVGIGLLIVSIEILGRSVGVSWLRAITEFLQGNLHFVVYSFFREIFNSIGSATDPHGAAVKNEVAVGVLVLGLIFRAASNRPHRDWVGMAFIALALGLLLLLNTRSVLIAAALSLMLALVVGATSGPQRHLPELFLKGAAVAALVVFAIGQSLAPEALSGTLNDRFAFDDASTAARFEQFSAALQLIELNPLAGNGFVRIDGYAIHNLFLNAWVQGGLAAFLLVLAAYCGLLFCWVSFVWNAIRRPQRWVLPVAPEWIAPLPITGLFRVWSSGDGGNLFLGEWVAIGCFFGCCLANEMRLKAARRAAVRPQEWSASNQPSGQFAHSAPY